MTDFVMLKLNLGLLEVMDKCAETASIGITLFVGGSILSGDLISAKEYIKEVVKRYESAKTDHRLNEINQLINKQMGETISNALDKAIHSPPPPEEKQEIDAIYLKNIIVWTPHNVPVPYNNALMELSMDAIDGFILGTPSAVPQ
ncbi:hypothetical protein [Methanothrix sp.]|uniref:hypothetical protein n=1 Tax=Methanothrix sp. TaxID=90426 RepID=UPI00345EF9AA